MSGSRHGTAPASSAGKPHTANLIAYRRAARVARDIQVGSRAGLFHRRVTAPVSVGTGPPINGRISPAIPSIARTHSPIARVEPESDQQARRRELKTFTANFHFQLASRGTNPMLMRASLIEMSGQLASFPIRLAPNSCRAARKLLWHSHNLNHAHCKIEFRAGAASHSGLLRRRATGVPSQLHNSCGAPDFVASQIC